jgi:hypothetical protein
LALASARTHTPLPSSLAAPPSTQKKPKNRCLIALHTLVLADNRIRALPDDVAALT